MSAMRTHRGGCHCGRVRFEVEAPAVIEALDCNCSICRMSGILHLIVPAARFRPVAGTGELIEYRFNTGVARHRFCRHCGIKSFHVPRSNPDGFDINVHCLDPATIERIEVMSFDDAQRGGSDAAVAHLSQPEPEPIAGPSASR